MSSAESRDGLRLDVARTSAAVAVKVTGELDIASGPALAAVLCDHAREPVVVDLRRCTFVDGSGLHVILEAARGNPRLLVSDDLAPPVARVVDLVGLRRVLPLRSTGVRRPEHGGVSEK
jgi:anti-anti-sigma factor